MPKRYKNSKNNSNNLPEINLISEDNYSQEEKLLSKGIYYITGLIENDILMPYHQDILLKHLTPSWIDDIQLIINSPGGLATEGWSFIDLLQWIRMDIRTIGMGECASLGAMLLAAGTKGKRIGTKNLSIMIHDPFIGHMEGTYNDVVAFTKGMEQEQERNLRFWLERTKLNTKEELIQHLLIGRDLYLTAQEALEFGIIDAIV